MRPQYVWYSLTPTYLFISFHFILFYLTLTIKLQVYGHHHHDNNNNNDNDNCHHDGHNHDVDNQRHVRCTNNRPHGKPGCMHTQMNGVGKSTRWNEQQGVVHPPPLLHGMFFIDFLSIFILLTEERTTALPPPLPPPEHLCQMHVFHQDRPRHHGTHLIMKCASTADATEAERTHCTHAFCHLTKMLATSTDVHGSLARSDGVSAGQGMAPHSHLVKMLATSIDMRSSLTRLKLSGSMRTHWDTQTKRPMYG
jgi:hypothetical protein